VADLLILLVKNDDLILLLQQLNVSTTIKNKERRLDSALIGWVGKIRAGTRNFAQPLQAFGGFGLQNGVRVVAHQHTKIGSDSVGAANQVLDWTRSR
jgi:hypothetical protein